MNFRWSDFVAMSAITAGAIVPTALLVANRSESAHYAYRVIEIQSIPQDGEYEALLKGDYRTTLEFYQECVDEFAAEDITRRMLVRFLKEQVDLHRREVVSIREATMGVRDRIVGDIATTRAEMVLKPELDAKADGDQTKRRRHRRKGPPCRRPPTRRPGHRHPGR